MRIVVEHAQSEAPRRRKGVVWLVVLVVLGAALIWSFHYKLNEYAITPGLAQPVGRLITVHDHPHAPARDTIYLTDVYLTQLNVWQWLKAVLHPVHEQLLPSSALTGGVVPTSELAMQGYLEMYDSQTNAKVVAMRELGLHVPGAPNGMVVVGITPGSSSWNVLGVADRVIEVRGHAVTGFCSYEAALAGASPGARIVLRVVPASAPNGVLVYGAPKDVTLTADAPPAGETATGCAQAPHRTVQLGIAEAENSWGYDYPVHVTIDTAYIGGPSAGLAMTLGVMDALSKVPITGTTKVAATGTISVNGIVGDVGGVAEKTIAVENAGATLFLVPRQEYWVAKHAASGDLKVVEVRTLAQALRAIRLAGGNAPVPITEPSGTGHTS